MAGKVVINLATGLEDAERVTVAFLVGGAAVEQGKTVTMFLTKEAVRLALPGYGNAVACDGCPPVERLMQQYAEGGASCSSARSASPLESLTILSWSKTPSWGALPRSGSGSGKRQQLSSVTECGCIVSANRSLN